MGGTGPKRLIFFFPLPNLFTKTFIFGFYLLFSQNIKSVFYIDKIYIAYITQKYSYLPMQTVFLHYLPAIGTEHYKKNSFFTFSS